MIGWRKIYAFFALAIYLIVQFAKINYQPSEKDLVEDKFCSETNCVRFCSDKESFVNFSKVFIEKDEKKIIKVNENGLIVTKNLKNDLKHFNKNFTIYRGDLDCVHESVDPITLEEGIKFDYNIKETGLVRYNKFTRPNVYNLNEYCFDFANSLKPEPKWRLKLCLGESVWMRIFHGFAISLSMIIIGFIIFTYGYYNELRGSYGKILIIILSAHLMLLLAVLLSRLFPNVFNVLGGSVSGVIFYILLNEGLIVAFLWFCVLVIHNFRKLNKFKVNLNEPDQSIFPYVIITSLVLTIFTIISLLLLFDIIPHYFNYIGLGIIWLIFLITLIAFILSAFNLIGLSKGLEKSEKKKFDEEKEWFWNIIAILIILCFYWVIEPAAWLTDKTHLVTAIALMFDFINLFTSLNLFALFIMKDNVKELLAKSYRDCRKNPNDI